MYINLIIYFYHNNLNNNIIKEKKYNTCKIYRSLPVVYSILIVYY